MILSHEGRRRHTRMEKITSPHWILLHAILCSACGFALSAVCLPTKRMGGFVRVFLLFSPVINLGCSLFNPFLYAFNRILVNIVFDQLVLSIRVKKIS